METKNLLLCWNYLADFGYPVYALCFTCSKRLGLPIISLWAYLEKDIPETGGATTFDISVFIIHNLKTSDSRTFRAGE